MKKFLTCDRLALLEYDFIKAVEADPALRERMQDLLNPPDIAGRVMADGELKFWDAFSWLVTIKWEDGSVETIDYGDYTSTGKAGKAFKAYLSINPAFFVPEEVPTFSGLSHISEWIGVMTKAHHYSNGNSNIKIACSGKVLQQLPNNIPDLPLNLSYMFTNCAMSAEAAQSVAQWNVSKVTSFRSTFARGTAGSDPVVLDLSAWTPKSTAIGDSVRMFMNNAQVNFDASHWCAWPNLPSDFALGATNWTLPKPSVCNNG